MRPGWSVGARVHDDDMLKPRAVTELLEHRQERTVDDHHLVAGVRDDVRQLVGVQADIERMEHGTHRRDADVGLEMLVVVPAQRSDAVVIANTELAQCAGQPVGAEEALAVRRAVERLVGAATDDRLARMQLPGPARHGRNRELKVHHQAVHMDSCR